MTDETAKTSFFADDPPPDPRHPGFDFTTGAYVSAPELFCHENDPTDIINIRKEDDRLYRQSASPTTWKRFVILGYQTSTGKDFAKLWTQKREHPLRFHRAVWYNYLSYVDRGKDVHEQLYFWANQIAQPFLAAHDNNSLDMDTLRFKWDILISHMERRTEEWKPVGKRNRSPRRHDNSTPTTDNESIQLETDDHTNVLPPNETPIPTNRITHEGSSESAATNHPDTDNSTQSVHHHNSPDEYSLGDTKRSAVQTINEISTNDGTHRITLKWKLSKTDYNRLTHDDNYLNSQIHSLLSVLFTEQDGCFYPWGNDDLSHAKSIQHVTGENINEFLAPVITKITTHHLIIFAIRFGYVENPISWKSLDRVKSAFKLNNLQVSVSNSKSTSGKLSIAGYVLVKHPKMTHRHRYLKFLRSQLPEATPFFDIVYHRTTPMDQSIGHLAIQCGENHIIPVCQALSALLTGKNTAVFLPRFAFGTMTDEQIRGHFLLHEQYVKSLHQLSLSPLITNLDNPRVEFNSDGTTIERTTREWAYSLTLPDGIPAQCDVVNGGNDKNTYLLVPAAFLSSVKPLLEDYKTRLRARASREARYRERIPDLPNVIHFTPHVQSNLDYMAKLSSADVWSKAPLSVKEGSATSNSQASRQSSASPRTRKEWPSLVKRPTASEFDHPKQNRKRYHGGVLTSSPKTTEANTQAASIIDLARGDATTSTQSLTNTLRSAQATRLMELESEMSDCRNMLEQVRLSASSSTERLATTEQHLESTMLTLTDLARSVANIQNQFLAFTSAMELMQKTLHTITTQGFQPHLLQPDANTQEHQVILHHDAAPSALSPESVKSPDKKKSKNQSQLDPCQRVLFSEYYEINEDIDMDDQSTDTLSTNNPQNPSASPPDTQNNNQCDPAGRSPE